MPHLTASQRYTISVLLKQNKSQKEIAEAIGKDKSVVCRELRRNCDKRGGNYIDWLAQRKYRERMKKKPKSIRFTGKMKEWVEKLLQQEDYSPEQIVGIARKYAIDCVSHERIYQHIWENKKQGGWLFKHLRNKGKRYRKRGSKKDNRGIIPNRVDIDQRPQLVNERCRFGDLEIDTIVGKNRKGSLVTINERSTGLVIIRKVEAKEAHLVTQATLKALIPNKDFIHTITADNGKEFSLHQQISRNLEIGFFFSKPYHSWQRGANENLNGLIRQYFPKKTNFADITEEKIRWVQERLNNRPRKRFNFLSPIELLNQQKVAFVT
jgi:transposase, IS30 family